MARFDGQIAIVTGAGGGLGRAHALLLAAEGASVVVNDYGGDSHGNAGTSAMAEAVVDEITSSGGIAVADSHDVATQFVVGGGRAARVVLATVPGLRDLTTIDDCLARFDEAMDTSELTVPADAMHAVIYECAQIGLDLSRFTLSS